jgi:hypothetical protein
MLQLLATLLLAVSVAATEAVVVQDKPDLSGKWVFDHDETPAEAKGTGNLGPEFTLAHDVKTLKFERTLANKRFETITYVLDGSETQHRKPDINGEPGPIWTSRSSWRDSTLQIVSVEDGVATRIGGPGGVVEQTMVKIERRRMLSLAPDGTLVSEMTSKSTGREWSPVTRSIYKKG